MYLGPDKCLFLVLKEAYEEFKHVLLALIYDRNDNNSPVANEVSSNFLLVSSVTYLCLPSI